MQYSIVNYKEVLRNIYPRFDAEYFQPYYIDLEKGLKKRKTNSIGELSIVTDGEHGSPEIDEQSGIIYLSGNNIRNGLIDFGNVRYCSEKLHNKNLRSSLKKENVLLSIVGIVGEAAIVSEHIIGNTDRNVATIKRIKSVDPYYLTIFLNSKYGRYQTSRYSTGNVQPLLNLLQVKNICVFIPEENFQKAIRHFYSDVLNKIKKSKSIYNQAQTLLLSELGLLDWQPKHALTFVRNYSETEQAGRFDAEYFQPKYDEIVKTIKNYKGGWDTLGNLVSVKKCVEVGSEEYMGEGIPFVRVSNLSPFEITEEKYISEKLYSELTEHKPKQGEILLSKDATPGIAYYLQEKLRKMIPSGGILRLKLKDNRVNEEYLTLVLNSLIAKEQINRDVVGSVILHWRPDHVKKILIPILDKNKQNKIRQKITESFRLRKQSKHLLECSKKSVEMAIEKDEKTAMQWLQEQTKNNC